MQNASLREPSQTAPIVRQLKYALKENKSRHVYIGSGEKARHLARSPLAMPYELRVVNWKDDAERDEKIAAYKVWLWRIMKDEKNPRHTAVWTELRKLRPDSILLCYCYPRNCHGHVIVQAWKWAVANGKIDAPQQEPPLQQTSTNAEQLKTLETQARANVKTTEDNANTLAKVRAAAYQLPTPPTARTAPGPLDMQSVLRELGKQYTQLADATLDEEILAEHTVDCDQCQPAPAKPRTPRRPRLSFDEPRSLVYNMADDMLMDLAELAPILAKHEAQDRAFDRAEMRYEREQLAFVCHESVSEGA